jgi:hypothetical protein
MGQKRTSCLFDHLVGTTTHSRKKPFRQLIRRPPSYGVPNWSGREVPYFSDANYEEF